MLRALFAGSPRCSVPALEALAGCAEVAGVLTTPPAARKRSSALIPSEVAVAAEGLKEQGKIAKNAPIFAPERITDAVREEIAALAPDILVCFAYGKIFSERTLDLFPKGAYNIHPSLLPRWRGPSPVQAAILARDKKTGVTVQRISKEMDAGDIAAQVPLPLDGTECADELLERLSALGAGLLPAVLEGIEDGTLRCLPQEGEPCYCHLIEKNDGEIDWSASAEEIEAKVRALSPWPGAFTTLPVGGGLLFIRKASICRDGEELPEGAAGSVFAGKGGLLVLCGKGALRVERLQRQARPEMDWRAFLNGNKAPLPKRFGGEIRQ